MCGEADGDGKHTACCDFTLPAPRTNLSPCTLLFCPAICLPPRSFYEDVSVAVCRDSSATSERAGEVLSEPSRRRHGRGGGGPAGIVPRGLQRGLTHGFSAYFGCLSLPISDSARLPLSVHGIHKGYLAS